MLNSSNFSKFHLSVNCPVGEPAVGELGVGELACRWTVLSVNCLVGEPAVGEPAVGELGVGELSVGEQSVTDFNHNLIFMLFWFLNIISLILKYE